MNLLQQRYENNDITWKNEKQQSMWICYAINSIRFFRSRLFVVHVVHVVNDFLFQDLQSIKTRRLIKTRKIQIREIWNSTRSRNRYRFVVFAFVLFWNINRFIILICKYFREQNSQQNFQQSFHFCRRIYLFFFFSHIFCFRIYFFTFIAFVLNFFVFVTFRLIFESQSTNFFAMSIDKRSDLFASKRNLKKTKKQCYEHVWNLDWKFILSAKIHIKTSANLTRISIFVINWHVTRIWKRFSVFSIQSTDI